MLEVHRDRVVALHHVFGSGIHEVQCREVAGVVVGRLTLYVRDREYDGCRIGARLLVERRIGVEVMLRGLVGPADALGVGRRREISRGSRLVGYVADVAAELPVGRAGEEADPVAGIPADSEGRAGVLVADAGILRHAREADGVRVLDAGFNGVGILGAAHRKSCRQTKNHVFFHFTLRF